MRPDEVDCWETDYRTGSTPWDCHGVPRALVEHIRRAVEPGGVLVPGCGAGCEVCAFPGTWLASSGGGCRPCRRGPRPDGTGRFGRQGGARRFVHPRFPSSVPPARASGRVVRSWKAAAVSMRLSLRSRLAEGHEPSRMAQGRERSRRAAAEPFRGGIPHAT